MFSVVIQFVYVHVCILCSYCNYNNLSHYNYVVPTVSGVVALALTLDTVQVDVTVSDDGGQPVLEYTVSQTWVNGWLYVTGVNVTMDGCTLLGHRS